MNNAADAAPAGSQASGSIRSLDELPGPKGLPLLGNALELEPKQLHRLIGGWADQFGPMFVFRVATKKILTIADAEVIQQVLRERPERFRRWSKIEELGAEIGADGVFVAEGEKWRRQRKAVMYALNASHVRAFIPRMEEVVGRLRRRWWRSALSGAPVDVLHDLMRLTVDVTSGLAFGRDINTLEERAEPIQKHLDKLLPAVARRQTALLPYWRFLPVPVEREVAVAVKEIGKFIDGLVAEARVRLEAEPERRAHPQNLLEALIVAHDADPDSTDDREIPGNVTTLLLAGEDTTANTLTYMIHYLKERPDVQTAVQSEVDRVFGMEEQQWQDPNVSDRLHYIEAFANETMRCKPVGGLLFMEPNEDVQIRGVFVPRGTPVLVLNGHVGSQEGNFADAKAFRPERWLHAAAHPGELHNTKAFMPFGAGPRFCPGRQLAMLQIKMVIAMLCRDFEVAHPTDAAPLEDAYGFTVGPTNVAAVLRPRRSLRFGVDLDLRVGDRRADRLPISFADRRVADRRGAQAA